MVKKIRHILIVFGTRPEAIKLAPLVYALRNHPNQFRVSIFVTAQHREMLDQVLSFFDIQPDIDLNLMQPGQQVGKLTAEVLSRLTDLFLDLRPEMVVVHGDTSSALAAAMAAFFLKIPVAHVEAGLRTNRIREPFPEEFNRQVISKVATLHFAPTERNRAHLIHEGISDKSVIVTGNTVIDALHLALAQIDGNPIRLEAILKYLSSQLGFDWQREPFILITGHRRENFGQGILEICNALKILAQEYPQFHFVYPVHLNPNIREPVYSLLGEFSNIHLLEPLDYPTFLYLMKHSYLILTDSGGIQEEAPSLGKPVLVMREVSERPEAIEFGTVKLVGAHTDVIIRGVKVLIDDKLAYQTMAKQKNPYGDGRACERIIEALGAYYEAQ